MKISMEIEPKLFSPQHGRQDYQTYGNYFMLIL